MRNLKREVLYLFIFVFAAGMFGHPEKTYSNTISISKSVRPASIRKGIASWYSPSDRGISRYTANGEVFRGKEKTCATWHYKFGTYLKVTNEANGKSVVCRVNDRGPARRFKKRVIDLSRPAFKQIASPKHGLVKVLIVPLPEKSSTKKTGKKHS